MADEQTNESTEQTGAEGAEGAKPEAAPEKPAPWGDDFDAERAWTLVQNLRKDLTEKSSALKAREDAEKTEAEKTADRLKEAEQAAKEARRELLVERAQRKHNLPDDVVEFLIGDTEEEIEAKASRLAALSGAKKTESGEGEAEEQGEKPAIPGKPKPALTPGHGGESASEEFDPDAIAKSARRGY